MGEVGSRRAAGSQGRSLIMNHSPWLPCHHRMSTHSLTAQFHSISPLLLPLQPASHVSACCPVAQDIKDELTKSMSGYGESVSPHVPVCSLQPAFFFFFLPIFFRVCMSPHVPLCSLQPAFFFFFLPIFFFFCLHHSSC